MPYYNRRQLLLNVLKSIDYYNNNYKIETIIVDDGSDSVHNIDDTVELFPKLNINLIKLQRDTKWRGPAIAYNTGFNAAVNDAILINSAECIHLGDILGYVFSRLNPKEYLNFSAYMSDNQLNDKINNLNWKDELTIRDVASSIDMTTITKWGCHSKIGNYIPYCAAINREDMETLSGYDERFAAGIGFDDYDFTDRIYNLGLNMIAVDIPFCIHQYHTPTNYINNINIDFLWYLRKSSPHRIKPTMNKVYVR